MNERQCTNSDRGTLPGPSPDASLERPFEVHIKERGDARVIVVLEDNLTVANVDQFRSLIQHMMDQGETKVILNMRNIQYVDSTGLGALIGMSEAMRYGRGRLVLLEPQPSVVDMLEVTQMKELFSIVGTN